MEKDEYQCHVGCQKDEYQLPVPCGVSSKHAQKFHPGDEENLNQIWSGSKLDFLSAVIFGSTEFSTQPCFKNLPIKTHSSHSPLPLKLTAAESSLFSTRWQPGSPWNSTTLSEEDDNDGGDCLDQDNQLIKVLCIKSNKTSEGQSEESRGYFRNSSGAL